MGLSLLWTTGRADKKRAENCFSALPYSRSCRRSGRSPALPYPPHVLDNFITLEKEVGAFLKLKWVRF